jgi:uncharacterized cupredoxin-like copper-binding protein
MSRSLAMGESASLTIARGRARPFGPSSARGRDALVQVRNGEVADLALEDVRRHGRLSFRSDTPGKSRRDPSRAASLELAFPLRKPWYVAAVLLLGLSTGHKIGLALAVVAFAGFSLIVAMLVPRWRPQFPGRGLPVFLAAIGLMFVGMLAAVEFFGKESGEATTETATTTGTTGTTTTGTTTAAPSTTVAVSEVEFKITFPKTSLPAGSYTFDVRDDGKIPHDLVVKGEGVDKGTPLINPGQSKSLTVDLKPGTYDVYCSVPGHKQAGMDLTLTIT